jgi:hypothetical protein
MVIPLYLALLVVNLAQAAAPKSPILIGANAGQVSENDIADLERITGSKPWLIDSNSDSVGILYADVYLPPDATNRDLSRGRKVALSRCSEQCVKRDRWDWRVDRTGQYAQVSVEGRAFADVRNSLDPNRPFGVDGKLEDTDIVSLVRFIRSKPAGFVARNHDSPASNFQLARTAEGNLPVISVRRATRSDRLTETKAGQIIISIRKDDYHGQNVILDDKKGGNWVANRITGWEVGR